MCDSPQELFSSSGAREANVKLQRYLRALGIVPPNQKYDTPDEWRTFQRLRQMAGIVRDDGHAISLGCMI